MRKDTNQLSNHSCNDGSDRAARTIAAMAEVAVATATVTVVMGAMTVATTAVLMIVEVFD